MKFTTIMLLAGTMTAFAMPASPQDAGPGEKVFTNCTACPALSRPPRIEVPVGARLTTGI